VKKRVLNEILIHYISKLYNNIFRRFVMDYRHIRVIGSGTFGCVYEAEHIIDKQKYAVKCVAFRYCPFFHCFILHKSANENCI